MWKQPSSYEAIAKIGTSVKPVRVDHASEFPLDRGARAPERSVMSEEIERTRVTFDSGGAALVDHLHRPADATGKVPCVVMGGTPKGE
jgi:hypothetical protein